MLRRSLRILCSIASALREAARGPDAKERWRLSLPAGSLVHATIEITGHEPDAVRIVLGSGCEIQRGTSIWLSNDAGADAKLTLGDRVYMARDCFLACYQPISIGSHTQLGAYCYIISANHRFDRRDVPIRDQGFTGAPVVLEEDVWLGTHVTVLPGVTIGKGAIVGANSVVTGDIPPYEIWAGVPARFIKKRPG
jgi:acetyltransferase-like isoleucine patch superfamily enzyme